MKFIFTLFILSSLFISHSQTKLVSNNPDDIPKLTIWGGAFMGPTSTNWGGVSYLYPKLFFVKGRFARKGYEFEGYVFFLNWLQS